jgi:hypothetical protein
VVETNKPNHINMPPYNKTSKKFPQKKNPPKIIQSLEPGLKIFFLFTKIEHTLISFFLNFLELFITRIGPPTLVAYHIKCSYSEN